MSEKIPGVNSWPPMQEGIGRPALVVGNGPSRSGREDLIHKFPGVRIGCNSVWKHEWAKDLVWDWLVCWDNTQIADILNGGHQHAKRLCFLGKKFNSVAKLMDLTQVPKPICSFLPFVDTEWGKMASWKIEQGPIGSLTGFTAFNLAWVLGCAPIFLLGIDSTKGTSCESEWVGYRDGHQPRRDHLTTWRLLTTLCPAKVLRAAAGGALDWLPVEDPIRWTQRSPSWLQQLSSLPLAPQS